MRNKVGSAIVIVYCLNTYIFVIVSILKGCLLNVKSDFNKTLVLLQSQIRYV